MEGIKGTHVYLASVPMPTYLCYLRLAADALVRAIRLSGVVASDREQTTSCEQPCRTYIMPAASCGEREHLEALGTMTIPTNIRRLPHHSLLTVSDGTNVRVESRR